MKRDSLIVGGLLVVAAGCTSIPGLPSQLKPPGPDAGIQVKDDPASMDVKITVNWNGPRSVQYNGPASALQNDIANMIVGLFDNGTGASFVSSLGYYYPGAASTAPTPTTLTMTSPAFMADLQTRLGTNGTDTSNSGETTINSNTDPRRYLIRDYLTVASPWASGTTTTVFTKVPYHGVNGHKYILFAAAYDSVANMLGYSERISADTLLGTTATSPTTAAVLNVNLKNNVYTGTMSETPTITTYVPSAQ